MIANADGVEKIIDYSQGQFKEVAQNVIPLFTKDDWDRTKYYICRREIKLDETENWLR